MASSRWARTPECFIAAVLAAVSLCIISEGVTYTADINALRDLKAAVDPASILPTSCLSSWDFSYDPCDSLSSTVFVCGFQCATADDRTMRIASINLDEFGYRGTLPTSLQNFSSLQLLDISGNAFNGSIPDAISHLSTLIKIDLSRNSFSGTIPSSIGMLPNLQYLSLSYNMLEGPIPDSINHLVSLERLYLFNNKLTGSIPALDNLNHLLFLDASSNFLSGWVSSPLPSSLMQLSLRGNYLQGPLPDFSFLQQLEVIDLSNNSFTDSVDAPLFQLPSLQQLNLSNNNLTAITAAHDVDVGSSPLIAIDLSYNDIRGTLPLFLANMKKLSALSLRHNFLSGSIPIQYAVKAVAALLIGARPLMRLYLDGNYLQGELPAPFLGTSPGTLVASFTDNCLLSCPANLPFCQGASQKPHSQCQRFSTSP